MDKTTHLFDEGIYHISNKTTAQTPFFITKDDQELFISNLDTYLGDICEILEYRLFEDHYRLVIRLKSRENIESFYRDKHKKPKLKSFYIRASTYIFSQQMANLQSGYAKKMNWTYSRKGAFFAGRFDRKLIENKDELNEITESIRNGERYYEKQSDWEINREVEFHKDEVVWNSGAVEGAVGILGAFRRVSENDLEALFEFIPPKHLFSPFIRNIIKDFKKKFKFDHLIN